MTSDADLVTLLRQELHGAQEECLELLGDIECLYEELGNRDEELHDYKVQNTECVEALSKIVAANGQDSVAIALAVLGT